MKPPPTRPKKPSAAKAPAPLGKQETKIINKTFQVKVWSGDNEGEKIIVYADSGMGKTTLGSMAPTPVFIGLDDGGRKIVNPKTGEPLNFIDGIETFDDVRAALHQYSLFDDYQTVVIDTGTRMEDLALDWTLDNVKTEKGAITNRIEGYGWGKGYRHLYDTMRFPLTDLDPLVRKGKNILILCQMAQVSVANSGGEDFLCDVPKLQAQHGKTCPAVWSLYNEWADHVLKIGLNDLSSRDGKAASSGERVIFVHGQVHFKAKSRTIPCEYPLITFSEPADDAIWQYLFDECWKEETNQ